MGGLWAFRRFQTGLWKTRLAKPAFSGVERLSDTDPVARSYWGGLPSGILLLALTISMSFGINALSDHLSQVAYLHLWIDLALWVWYLGWYLGGAFLIGLLSESRGVGMIPIFGFLLGLTLWHSTPGESVDALSYDMGWYGFLLFQVGMHALIMYLLFRLGRALR